MLPPGPAGHQPSLALVYNSGDGRGLAGWLGFGWSLSGESWIERETRTGTPYDLDNYSCGGDESPPCYREVFALDGEDLICASATCTSCSAAGPCTYKTQSDDGRIIKYKGQAAGWVVLDREGRTSEYGASSNSQLLNPLNGQTFRWAIERSVDVSGNVISYEYDQVSSPNVLYPSRVA